MMLVLASNSPRRKELLALGGWEFRVQPAEIDEQPWPSEPPRAYVLRLAEAKARVVGDRVPPEALVVAADTTVVDEEGGDLILGKPADAAEAGGMLRRLAGREHRVYTGLAVLRVRDGALRSELCATRVRMRPYSEAEIQAYIASGDPLDKAGGYAIQHPGFHPVESLTGCYTNVVGLPLCRLMRLLTGLGLPPAVALPYDCLYSPSENQPFHPEVCLFPPGILSGDSGSG